MSIKQAILTPKESGRFTTVVEGPFPSFEEDQILIKTIAFAVNPTDWKHRDLGWGNVGSIAGSDTAGIVAKVGSKVKGIKEGDVVSAFIHGNSSPTLGAFAEYAVADPEVTIIYPKDQVKDKPLPVGESPSDKVNTYEAAASLTLSLSTAALSFAHVLKPSYNKSTNADKYFLVWGGATAAGILAIQVAKLTYGLKVIATASPSNHKFLKSLGADAVFDYRSPTVVEEIRKYANGKIRYALDTVGSSVTFQSTYDATSDSEEVTIDNLLFLGPDAIKIDSSRKVTFGASLAYLANGKEHLLGGVKYKGDEKLIKDFNEFWQNHLAPLIPELKTSHFVVLESGLESSNEGYELLAQDKVNAQKVVFRI